VPGHILLAACDYLIIDSQPWKVSILVDQNIEQKLQSETLILRKKLLSVEELSEVFLDMAKKHLHVVVKVSSGGECQCSCICIELMITLLLPQTAYSFVDTISPSSSNKSNLAADGK
jgi:hypothetical protein